MNPSHWTQPLEQIAGEFATAFGPLSATQLNWKPGPDRWSIGQVIDHLITTNSTYFPIIAAMKAGTYKPHFNAKIGFLVSFFGKLILGSVQPEATRKQKTFPPFEPSQSSIPADIVKRLEARQAQLIREIVGAQDLLNCVVSSPANRYVVYRLDRAFDILVAHERRHLLQAKAILAQMPDVVEFAKRR
ncbi:MAG: DinB family protein [Acidobacteriota bacterium]